MIVHVFTILLLSFTRSIKLLSRLLLRKAVETVVIIHSHEENLNGILSDLWSLHAY